MLDQFFVVTMTSLYRVFALRDEAEPQMEKVALREDEESRIGVGQKLSGPMLSVGKQLVAFIPEGGGITSFERELGKVNTRYWLHNTSFVAALFLKEVDAQVYFRHR